MEEQNLDNIKAVLDAQDTLLEDGKMLLDIRKIRRFCNEDPENCKTNKGICDTCPLKSFYIEKDLIDFFDNLIKQAIEELKKEKYATGRVEKGAKLFLLKRIKKSLEGSKT